MKTKLTTSRTLWLALATTLLVSPGPVCLHAAEFAEHQVRTAVQTWVRRVTADARPGAVVQRLEPYLIQGRPAAYIAHLEDGGFCLCGTDSLVLPVYWYSPKGTYDPKNSGLRCILQEIAGRIDYLRRDHARLRAASPDNDRLLAKRAEFWAALATGQAPSVPVPPEPGLGNGYLVLPFTSQWSQDPPYNGQCPDLPLGSGNHAVVGCVATATAQIMYYWRWPATGLGTGSTDYRWRWAGALQPSARLDNNPRPDWGNNWTWTHAWSSASNRIADLHYYYEPQIGQGFLSPGGLWDESLYTAAKSISENLDYRGALDDVWGRLTQATTTYPADFGATTYDWSLLDNIHTANTTASRNAEVAKLCLHVGIAVNMNYGLAASSSDQLAAEFALEDHFRYDSDAGVWARNVDDMAREIDWLRPLELGGADALEVDSGKHTWVVFGYNKNTDPWQFWMNLGWGSTDDGWYSVDQIKYKELQFQLTRIAPVTVKFVGAPDPGDGSPDDPYQDIREAASEAPNGSTLIFKAGSLNTFSGSTLRIDRPMTLKSMQAIVRAQ